MISNLLQVILAITIVLILLFIAFMVYNYERNDILKNSKNIKKKIKLFEGIYDYSINNKETYDTYSVNKNLYKDLSPSINQRGGAEYSYNFWLKIDRGSMHDSTTAEDIILFLRGSILQVPYKNAPGALNTDGKNCLIRIDKKGSSLIVEYNTLTNPDSYRESGIGKISCDGESWDDRNKGLLGIYNMTSSEYNNKWFMVTVVLREITPENDVLNKFKTSCKIYLNGFKMLDREVEAPYNGIEDQLEGSAAMKHNNSPLHLNPGNILLQNNTNNSVDLFGGESNSPLQMADLTYFNYSITDNQIRSLFNGGFSKKPFVPASPPDVIAYPIADINKNTLYSNVKPY
jgi:predicted small secreted protein